MKMRWNEFPLTVEEVRRLMKKDDHKKYAWLAVAISVIAILVGVMIWIMKKREKDLEEHYEYFDDDFDELDEHYDEYDDSIYDDEDEDEIEYVKIKDFMSYADDEKANAKDSSTDEDQQEE